MSHTDLWLLAGDVDAGIRIYERALAFNPRYPDALYNLVSKCLPAV